ncbi:hypothetical protein GLOIN_2v1885572 [Rhizophagus irregularis DAOM 181602=DAOM 197198]|uniref:Uncharacterized protein n=1 Tax=Rhizophagus irregularis (strain DAOM 181602 / DAOM 197198 / MUCL 43194) TaxID=747089 RepID=A0A2P4P085_RHIID|nr:hypothetical protein GLOIN_2v1885572 [Rhizophagus irregularis DAOM 181602=DAOM 197198]POG58792.1 hypothetical protein GLOIN_2v1885572 [Rhizophagus irregularis DAOM 181602=DAOM 197198]CAG8493246.1 19726_t:CDS:2 [Rhizophagus irregularis]|eukprot:XP_025165658.1 hypothetical protein GLOIN_2v1885572 [Rhizophagus irregularis DAOM 181602=DAOM 197198]
MDEEKVSTAQLTDRRMTTEPPPPPLVDEIQEKLGGPPKPILIPPKDHISPVVVDMITDLRKNEDLFAGFLIPKKTEASTTDGTKEGKKRVIEGIDEVVKVIKKETAKTKHKIKKNKNARRKRLRQREAVGSQRLAGFIVQKLLEFNNIRRLRRADSSCGRVPYRPTAIFRHLECLDGTWTRRFLRERAPGQLLPDSSVGDGNFWSATS